MRRTAFYLLGLLSLLDTITGCAGRARFFQPDARVAAVRSASADSALVTAGRHYAAHGRVFRWIYGDHYRALWATPVALPVLNISQLPGRPHPTELGGGFQTTSVTLEAADGRRWVVRSIDKDPYKTLPKALRHTFALRLVRDETSAANPYAPWVLPALSAAAGVPHTTPHFYYVPPGDTALGRLTHRLDGQVVLVEEKLAGAEAARQLGDATDVVESDEALQHRFASPAYQFDQLACARARLFDLWIGDWDRHEGQWTWAERVTTRRNEGQPTASPHSPGHPQPTHMYRPIPKDRDQAFFRFDDGLLTWLVARRWAVRKLRSFRPRFDDVRGLGLNARFLDQRVLSAVTGAQFDSLAHDLQHRLTDTLIDQALRRWPAPVYQQEGARTIATLRARRADLPRAARAFYESLAREPLVVGTDLPERLTLHRHPDGQITVTIAVLPDHDAAPDPPYYQRTFLPAETKRVRVYGLGGADELVLTGRGPAKRLRVDFYGGEGEDHVRADSTITAQGVRVLDTKRGILLPDYKLRGLKRHLSDRGDTRIHAFDREGL